MEEYAMLGVFRLREDRLICLLSFKVEIHGGNEQCCVCLCCGI